MQANTTKIHKVQNLITLLPVNKIILPPVTNEPVECGSQVFLNIPNLLHICGSEHVSHILVASTSGLDQMHALYCTIKLIKFKKMPSSMSWESKSTFIWVCVKSPSTVLVVSAIYRRVAHKRWHPTKRTSPKPPKFLCTHKQWSRVFWQLLPWEKFTKSSVVSDLKICLLVDERLNCKGKSTFKK